MRDPQRVSVERELCLSAGYCARIAPATFVLDDERTCTVADADAATDEQLREAADSCPAGAIWVPESRQA